MIYFLTTRKARYTIGKYLSNPGGAALVGKIVPLTYGQFLRQSPYQPGTYIFADIERLSPKIAGRVAQKWQAMAAEGQCGLLNHPLRTMRRYQLLRTLHDQGVNDFNIFRPQEVKERLCEGAPIRYPVFVRGENDHKGAQSPLLHDEHELLAAMTRLRWRWKGWRPQVVTEFSNVADRDGVYRKYSAFKIGDQIIARHIFFANYWSVKGLQLLDENLLAEERVYFDTNPHESTLREIFATANIDFGRIDYGLIDGRIQVWEINTNPMLPVNYGSGSQARKPLLKASRHKMQTAFESLEADFRLAPAA